MIEDKGTVYVFVGKTLNEDTKISIFNINISIIQKKKTSAGSVFR